MTVVTSFPDGLRDRLAAFGPSMEGSSLYLMRAIEITCDSLQSGEELALALAKSSMQITEQIRLAKVVQGHYLDPEDVVINMLEVGYRALEGRVPTMLIKESSIDEDSNLNDDHRELLHTAYQRCVDAFAVLIESAKDLRAAVISHDLAAEGQPAQFFDSPKDLIASLHS